MEMPISNIKEMLELPILGIVPEDKNMSIAMVRKDAIMHTHPNSKAAKSYRAIAAKIAGIQYSKCPMNLFKITVRL
jgi:septum formation inhibitor-activating ATPase MinD